MATRTPKASGVRRDPRPPSAAKPSGRATAPVAPEVAPPPPVAGLVPVAVCFVLSGAASLVLQVVWTRLLRLTFGSTTLAVSTVLAAYMLGLGLGGLLGARLARRLRDGIRTYGWMEIGIGAYAVVVPFLLGTLPAVNFALTGALPFWPAAFCRFLLALAVMLAPTILMGATLPVLVEAMVRQRSAIASRVGLLYGLNTLGAVLGVFLGTFGLFPLVGVRMTNLIAAVIDVGVGLVALFVIAPRFGGLAEARQSSAPSDAASLSPANPPILAYATVGFTSLTYEVCWSRALSMILGSSIYAFATMLAAFLTGIALGSLVARRWFDRMRRPIAAYALGIALLGAMSLLTILAFRLLPSVFVDVILTLGTTPTGISITNISISMLAMLGPTLVLGALFPLLIRGVTERPEDAPQAVGAAYFTNTLGSAAGAFAAGFVLIPYFGLQNTMGVAVGLNFVVAGLLLLWQKQWLGSPRLATAVVGLIAGAVTMIAPPRWSPEALTRGVFKSLDRGDAVASEPLIGVPTPGIVYYREGVNTTVSVHRDEESVFLRVNGKTDASSGIDMGTQVTSGEVPMLFGGRGAERILVVGLASGVSVGSVALHDPELVEVVELEPAMLEASHYFDQYNHRPLERSNVKVRVDDGRNVLAYAHEPYDVIISEPSNPWISGASNLFTREFFAAVRRALKPGGQFLQWCQLYGMPGNGLRAILASLTAEFPYVYGFAPRSKGGDILFLARDRPLTEADLPRWENLSPQVRNDLQRINVRSTEDLWSLMLVSPEAVRALAAGAPAQNTDDNMFVEIASPWFLYLNNAEETYAALNTVELGALPVLEEAGVTLDDERIGALAHSYASLHTDTDLAGRTLTRGKATGANALTTRALLSAQKGEDQEAERLIEEAVAKAPASFIPRVERGTMRYWADDDEGALQDADAALAARPDDSRARLLRARALVALDRPAEAIPEFELVLASPYASVEPDAMLDAAQAQAAAGDMKKAIEGVKRYVANKPADAAGWYTLAQYYSLSGESAKATEAEENRRRAQANESATLLAAASQAAGAGMRDKAIELLELLLQSNPDYEPAKAELRRLKGA